MGYRLLSRLRQVVREHPDVLSHAEYRHASEIADRVKDERETLWASPEKLGKWLGISESYAKRVRRHFVQIGFLVPFAAAGDRRGGRRDTDGSGITATFKVVPEGLVDPSRRGSPSDPVPDDGTGSLPRQEGDRSHDEKGVAATTRRGSESDPQGVPSDTSSQQEEYPVEEYPASALSLVDAAELRYATPATKPEQRRRDADIRELEQAGVSGDELLALIEKAALRWPGVRPSLGTIVNHLGDLRDGFELPPKDWIERRADEQKYEQRYRRQLEAREEE